MPTEKTGLVVRKSNQFVTAKYKTTLLGNKLIAISLTKLKSDHGQMYAVLTPYEIRQLLGRTNDTNIYKKLKTVSRSLAGHVVTVEDGMGNFKTFSMITNVTYEDKQLKIIFNHEMTPQIYNLKNNYTTYELATLISIEKSYTYRLYEILKKELWRIGSNFGDEVSKTYNINELKCELGLVNLDADYIHKAVNNGKSWDDIVENIAHKEDKQFESYSSFRNRVLEPAREEMQEKCDICFDYEMIRGGRGGKARSITFYIRRNTPDSEIKNHIAEARDRIVAVKSGYDVDTSEKAGRSDPYKNMKMYLEQYNIDTESFTPAVFKKILDAADGDVDLIKQEIDYSLEVPNIRNYYGWLTTAVREHFSDHEPVETVNGSSEQARSYEQLREAYQNPSDEVLISLWEKYKKSDLFPGFLETFRFPDVDAIETMYSTEELITKFIDYKKKQIR